MHRYILVTFWRMIKRWPFAETDDRHKVLCRSHMILPCFPSFIQADARLIALLDARLLVFMFPSQIVFNF